MDARIRLDSLKSGCNPPLPYCATSRMLHNYSCEKHSWDSGELQEEETALDLVEILDIADEEQDEESWWVSSGVIFSDSAACDVEVFHFI